jgi:hypothetical protein
MVFVPEGRRPLEKDKIMSLANSMAVLGLVQPITVSYKGSRIRLVAGHNRLAAAAPWSEVDLDGRQRLIPGQRTKNSRDHLVPLSDPAAAVLESLPRIKSKVPLLFTTTGSTPISGLAKAKARLHEAMTRELGTEPERWTLHDIRRSAITGLQRLGFPLEVTEAVANHKSGTLAGVAGVYARHDYASEKRKALDAWAQHVMSVVAGNVIPLRKPAS